MTFAYIVLQKIKFQTRLKWFEQLFERNVGRNGSCQIAWRADRQADYGALLSNESCHP
jgi:hypothetical protein